MSRYIPVPVRQDAWEKTETISGCNPKLYRKDAANNVIYRPSEGKNSPMGFEWDHKHPHSNGGTSSSRNIQPLQTAQNRHKSNTYPYAYDESLGNSPVSSDVDLRSSLIKSNEFYLKPDGTADARSSAVHTDDVLLKQDGTVDRRSQAVIDGRLILKD